MHTTRTVLTVALLLASPSVFAQPLVAAAPPGDSSPSALTATTHPIDAPPSAPATPAHASSPLVNVTASLGHGVMIRTEDNNFSLNIRARIQPRFTLSEQPERPQTEFQVRRMRFVLQGNVLNPNVQYYIQLGFSNGDTESDLRLPLRDATITWTGIRDLNLRFGQGKVPFGRQRVVSSSAMQMVDRSLAVGEFNLDRDVGFQIFSRDFLGLGKRLNYTLGIFGGDGRNRVTDQFGMLYVARVQVQPFGEYDDLVEADVTRLTTPRLAIGFAVGYNQNSRRARSTHNEVLQTGFDYMHIAADLQFKWHGFSLQSEWLYRRANDDTHTLGMDAMGNARTESSRSGHGYYVQAGYLFNPFWEVSARWGEVFPFSGTSSALHRQRELGAGLSWYVSRHDLKLQTDYFWLAGDNFSDGRHQWRVQAQLYF
jgi:phosphate-selective porin OprO and OprP